MSATSVILMPLNFNGLELLKLAVPKLIQAAHHSQYNVELWVVDNASVDESYQWLQNEYPQVKWFGLKENLKLTAYNKAISESSCEYVMILNNDVLVNEDFIDPLIERLSQSENVFAVSPKISADHRDEVWQDRLSGSFFHGHLAPKKLGEEPGGTLYCHGAAMMVRREIFLKLGGFDPLFFYFEDNDLSYRAWRAGYSCLFEPSVSVHHLGSQSVKKLKDGLEQKRAFKERANNFFILKNIQNSKWKLNFIFWSFLKLIKMVFTFDGKRFWAYRETYKNMVHLTASAKQQVKLDDEVLMQKIMDSRLSKLESESKF